MTFDKIVQKRMFLLIIFLLLVSAFFGTNEEIGINKTVHWKWDLSIWVFHLKSWSWLIFGLVYGLLALLKYWTNKTISILHLVLLILIFLTDNILNSDLQYMVVLHIASYVVFFANVLWAIRNRIVIIKKPADGNTYN